MANLFSDAVYLSAADVKDSTELASLKTLADSAVTRLIAEAQALVDAHVGSTGASAYQEGQTTLYPIKAPDGSPFTPREVRTATLYVVEHLHLLGAPTLDGNLGREIVAEKVGDHSVEYSAGRRDGLLPEKALRLLGPYRASVLSTTLA